jgi:D-amino-acid dehydrogenase
LEQALTVAPGLADAAILETRIGFRPMPLDGKPLIGRIPGFDGLVIANGLGSSGLTIGPYAGKLVASEALGLQQEIDLAPFAPLRSA